MLEVSHASTALDLGPSNPFYWYLQGLNTRHWLINVFYRQYHYNFYETPGREC